MNRGDSSSSNVWMVQWMIVREVTEEVFSGMEVWYPRIVIVIVIVEAEAPRAVSVLPVVPEKL